LQNETAMIEKLKLSFCLSSDLATPELEEAARCWFENQRSEAFKSFASGLNLSSNEAGMRKNARIFIETPVVIHPLFEPRAHKELATFAQNKIPLLFEAIDEAEFELTKESVEPAAAYLLPKRIERLRAEFDIWRDAIRNGNFEVYQTRPYETAPEYFERFPDFKRIYRANLDGNFPARRLNIPWQPAAAKVKQEPEYFRQIWLNPEEDIPFILEALKRLEFIDENEVWRWNTEEDNPRGVIEAIQLFSNLFSDFSGEHRARVFAQRFKFPNPQKRFEKKCKPFERAKTKMANYLKNNK